MAQLFRKKLVPITGFEKHSFSLWQLIVGAIRSSIDTENAVILLLGNSATYTGPDDYELLKYHLLNRDDVFLPSTIDVKDICTKIPAFRENSLLGFLYTIGEKRHKNAFSINDINAFLILVQQKNVKVYSAYLDICQLLVAEAAKVTDPQANSTKTSNLPKRRLSRKRLAFGTIAAATALLAGTAMYNKHVFNNISLKHGSMQNGKAEIIDKLANIICDELPAKMSSYAGRKNANYFAPVTFPFTLNLSFDPEGIVLQTMDSNSWAPNMVVLQVKVHSVDGQKTMSLSNSLSGSRQSSAEYSSNIGIAVGSYDKEHFRSVLVQSMANYVTLHPDKAADDLNDLYEQLGAFEDKLDKAKFGKSPADFYYVAKPSPLNPQ